MVEHLAEAGGVRDGARRLSDPDPFQRFVRAVMYPLVLFTISLFGDKWPDAH